MEFYKSPIQFFDAHTADNRADEFDNHAKRVAEAVDDAVLKEVRNVGIKVDKYELAKALAYDRSQYEQGFADATTIVMCEECKHRDDCEQEVLLASMFGEIEKSAHIIFCSYGERKDHE